MSNVPKLRFREFSGEWIKTRVGDVYSFKTTNSFSRDTLNYESGQVFNIHYGDIHTKFLTSFRLARENVPYINSEVQLEKIKKDNYCQVGDLVIADASEDYADIGKAIELIDLDRSDVLAGLHTILARPQKTTFALGFAGRLFQSWAVRKQIMRLSQGAKVLGLSKGYLSEVLLEYPALAEQQKIADFLTAVDIKIEQLTRKEELLKQYKKGVMQKIFSQEIRFKADDGSEFPEWEESIVGDHFDVGSSKRVLQQDWVTKGVPFYRTRELVSLARNEPFSSEIFITSELYAQLTTKYGMPRAGDYLVSGVGTLGIYYQVQDKDKFYFKDGNVLWLKRKPTINSDFFRYCFESEFVQSQIVAQASTTTVGTYTIQNARKTRLFLPRSLKEQARISAFLGAVDTKIRGVTEELACAKTFKKGLLQQMFV